MLFPSHEKQLVNRCLQNNRNAQKELFEKYYKAMFSIALRMVKDEDETYDVIQEAFISVFNNLHQFQFRSTLGAWIKVIVVREALKKVKPDFSNTNDPVSYEPVMWPDDLTGDYLTKAILDLPDGFRMSRHLQVFQTLSGRANTICPVSQI